MAVTDRKSKALLPGLWALGCSLKLAIALATATTALIMAGSLVMHFNPAVFAGMEQDILSRWLVQAWHQAPHLVFWIPLSGLCVLLFAINTLCCLIDWLLKIRGRWRKTGEYLIHIGFILLLTAYLWGSVSGFRSGPQRIFPGESLTIAGMPEYSLLLEEFTPLLEPSGRPLDMINRVSLWKNGRQVKSARVRINHPLIHDGLVILPASFGQEFAGFRFHRPGQNDVDLYSGSRLQVSPEITMLVDRFLADARQTGQGRVMPVSGRLNNPAMHVSLRGPGGQSWQGWYFLRQPLPVEMRESGVMLRPAEPLYKTYSLLTINRDPGDKLALTGSICIVIGVILAFFSFYRKRTQGDRPEI